MKKMKKIIYLCIFLLLFLSCKEKKQSVVVSHNATYTINVDSLKMEEFPLNISVIFKSVRTIILEDHEYAIIGQIDGIQVFENYIFVLDITHARKLFVFDRKNGKYIRQIGNMGHGPGEYVSLCDFCINKEKREIYLLDNLRKILIYDMDTGKHIKTLRYNLDEFSNPYIAYLNGKLYMPIIPDEDTDKSSNLLMEVDIETGEQKQYLDADTYNCGWNRRSFTPFNFFIAKLSDSPKFVELFMNTIMSIEKDKIRPYLTINHKDWVQKSDILSDKQLKDSEMDQFSVLFLRGRVWLMQHNYTESDRYIYFGYNTGRVLFDKHTQQTTLYRYMYNDLRDTGEGIGYTNLMFYDSKFAYEYFWNDQMFDIVKKIHKKNILNPNLDKKDELLKLDGESFVIFEYEFK
jgi:hypothetical protein